MNRDDTENGHVAVDPHTCPYPALHVTVENGEPVVTAVNDPFRSTFGTDPAGTPLSDVFDRCLESADGAELASQITRGDWSRRLVSIRRDDNDHRSGSECVLQGIEDVTDSTGYVLFFDSHDRGSCSMNEMCDVAPEQVASIISHDLRNPLDVAKANLQAGRETGEDEYLESVAQAHDRMERIIQDVLTLAREDEVVDPSESIELNTLVTNAWDTVDTKKANLTLESPLPEPTVDADRVERLLENIFRNAVDHAGPSSSVHVGRLDGDADGFYVADDGPGVPPPDREVVFEPGYTSTEHGTGLGLSIVDRIAAAHGWQVRLTGSENGGARFELRLDSPSGPA